MSAGVPEEFLYLSQEDIESLDVSRAAVEECVERVFAQKARGSVTLYPKTILTPAHGEADFFAMPGILEDPPVAALKWLGETCGERERVPFRSSGLLILSDFRTCAPRAVMAASWITAARVAAVTSIAARRLARPDSRSVGFVGCGRFARFHLRALADIFPLSTVHACGRNGGTARDLARRAADMGVEGVVVDEPRAAVEGMDIVVTTVPPARDLVPFNRVAWLMEGAFASLVDNGRSWMAEGFETIDYLLTDDHRQTAAMAANRNLPYQGTYHADLGEIVAGAKPGRRTAGERIVFLHPGVALCDLAVAALVYEEARSCKVGRGLPL